MISLNKSSNSRKGKPKLQSSSNFSYRTRGNKNVFQRLLSKFNYAVNISKKNDDLIYYNKTNSSEGFMQKIVASGLLQFLCLGISVVTIIVLVIYSVYFMAGLFSSDTVVDSSGGVSKSNVQFGTIEREVMSVVKLFQKQMQNTNPENSFESYREIDQKVLSLIDNYCINELPNGFLSSGKADNGYTSENFAHDAKMTFHSHVQYFLETISNKESNELPPFDKHGIAVSKNGNIIDLSQNKNHDSTNIENVDYGRCGLLTALATISIDTAGMRNTHKQKLNQYGYSDIEIWQKYEHRFSKTYATNVDKDAYELLKFIRDDQIDIAEQLIPNLLDMHCANVEQFLLKNGADHEVKYRVVSGITDILRTLKSHKTVKLNANEVPGVSTSGNLIAVQKFKLHDSDNDNEYVFGKDYSSCPLLDKIVLYHNADLKDQVKDALDQLRENNLFSFESKMDVMIYEHCPTVVSGLKNSNSHNENIYSSLFRGELLTFATQAAHNMFMGDSRYVITGNGGIIHESAISHSHNMIYECPVIVQIADSSTAEAQTTNSGKQSDEKKEEWEHRYDPQYQQQHASKEYEEELYHQNLQVDEDAVTVVRYALHNDMLAVRRLLGTGLLRYHPSKFGKQLSFTEQGSLVEQIEQYLKILIDTNAKKWPTAYSAFFDAKNLVIEKTNNADVAQTMVMSTFLTQVFSFAYERPQSKFPFLFEKETEENNNQNQAETQNQAQNEAQTQNQDQTQTQKQETQKQETQKQNEAQTKREPNQENSDVNTYAAVLWNDLKKISSMNELMNQFAGEIENDIRSYCSEMVGRLDGRAMRMLKSQMFNLLNQKINENKTPMADPMVSMSGIIKSKQNSGSEQLFECSFITTLLNQ